ncbi:MAG TPA: A24 family peptidase [Blastocatellia bacterium]|nr:A24 family peptidase [Blastocatellia bacterium]
MIIEPDRVDHALVISLTAFVLAVGYKDWRERRVPNLLVFPAAALGLGLNALKGWDGLMTAGIGLAAGFALLFLPYLVGGMRAGDVKFLAVVGAFTGAPQIVRLFLLTLLCYPLLAVFFVTRERKWKITMLRFRILLLKLLGAFAPPLRLSATRLEAEDDPAVESVRTPFSLAIAMGTLLTLYTRLLAYLL